MVRIMFMVELSPKEPATAVSRKQSCIAVESCLVHAPRVSTAARKAGAD